MVNVLIAYGIDPETFGSDLSSKVQFQNLFKRTWLH